MYVRSGKTDPGVAVSFGFGVGCWPRARLGATSPLTTNAAMLTATYRTAAPWVGRANVANTSVRRQRYYGGSELEAGRAELDTALAEGSLPLLSLPVPPHAPREQGADEPGGQEHHCHRSSAVGKTSPRRALWLAKDAARELPNLPLEDALQLVHLYAERGSPKYEKAVMRRLERAVTHPNEGRNVSVL